ncbi:hypothetical protein [Dehalobacter sp. TBBPA1]|uniref:hypothetical protein n=1 Tax=Dehalobacter sp. TBBPA1 TaxID=3235037 RepID=UPI0034A1110B
MDKFDNLNEIIEDKLNHIVVTDSLKERIKTKASKSKAPKSYSSGYKRAAICTVSFATVVMCIVFLFHSNISEAFEPLKKYIPGLNAVIVDSNDAETYALVDSSIIFQSENGQKIEILSCFTDGNVVKAVIRSNIPVEWKQNDTQLVTDSKGNKGKLTEFNAMGDGEKGSSDYEWIGSASFQFGRVVDRFDLLIGGLTVPVIMSKVEGVEHFEDFGNVSYENGIRVAALTQYKDNLLEVKLIGLSDDNKKILTYGNIYLVDIQGKKYLPVSSQDKDVPQNTFYFEARLKDDLEAVIPYIILADNENKKVDLKLEIPSEGDNTPVDLPVSIGTYNVNIVALQRMVNENSIVVRRSDGSKKTVENPSKTGLQIVIDKKFDKAIKNGLSGFTWSCDQKYNAIPLQIDGEATFVDPGYEQSDKYGEPRYEVISLPNFPAEQTTLDITLENFQYYREGDWSITLKK